MKESENFVMPIGKYRGETLLQIKEIDPDYLEFLYHNLYPTPKNEEVKSHIENLLSI